MEDAAKFKVIDTTGQNCPIPLLETRKAIIKGVKGDLIEIRGDHANSRKEIPMALASMNCQIIEEKDEGTSWTIRFRI
jgi:TusA-related sulfurtransferase